MTTEPAWVRDVLTFWFDELETMQWFKKDDDVDTAIEQRFKGVHQQVSEAGLDTLSTAPRTALAAVIVLDQFSRNMFRGTAKSFDSDPKALELAERILANGLDRDFNADEKAFCYLPFEHSEALANQKRSVELFQALGNENYANYAQAHLDIIEKFGRFPHRNAILGRTSTSEENEYLAQPGSGF